MKPAALLLSISLLIGCGNAARLQPLSVPDTLLTPPPRPDLPGPSNRERAAFVLAQDSHIDALECQIYDLAAIVRIATDAATQPMPKRCLAL